MMDLVMITSAVPVSPIWPVACQAGKDSGTTAARGDKNQLLDELDVEVMMWETGNRIAQEISSRWRAEAIAKKVLNVLREM
jgi:hypothetical protein